MEYLLPQPMKALEALTQLYPDSSKRTLLQWLKGGRFSVDGRPLLRGNEELQEGQKISSQEAFRPQKKEAPFPIVYSDRYFIVIEKPAGLLSVPLDDEEKSPSHALGKLKRYFDTDEIYSVHRIDRETSGLLLFARGKESEGRFKALFEEHALLREYFAIVEGRLTQKEGTWEFPLLELPSYRVVVSDEGKEAVTHFTVLRTSPKYTYLKLRLETGKKHQIRVHCQRAGHPVLGDFRYGAVENPIGRLCLHAITLAFDHPFTGKKMSFSSELPPRFKKLQGNGKLGIE